MESCFIRYNPKESEVNMKSQKPEVRSQNLNKNSKLQTPNSKLQNERGIALVISLMISLVVMLTIIGVLYFIIQSTTMSGAGKRYATAAEAADGAVEVMKDAVNLIMVGEPISTLPIVDDTPPCLLNAVLTENQICTTTINLPGTVSGFTATVVLERLYSSTLSGGRLEFARGGGAPTTGVYYRINTVVAGASGTSAETTALYRFTM
jgi:Tfp pilus assembly protein PilX